MSRIKIASERLNIGCIIISHCIRRAEPINYCAALLAWFRFMAFFTNVEPLRGYFGPTHSAFTLIYKPYERVTAQEEFFKSPKKTFTFSLLMF